MEAFQKSIAREGLASVVVFLVALPLCMGIAIASGVPPALGLITGIIGGLVVGFMAGAPLQVSGPAAGLTVLVWQVIERWGLPALGWVVLGAGVVQLLAGALRLGRWFRAVSPAVIQGMLGGIGVLIFASQFHVMVDDKPQSSGLVNLASIPSAIYKGIGAIDGTVHHVAAWLGVSTIVLLLVWNRFRPQKLHAIPGPLIAVAVVTAAAAVLRLPVRYVVVPSQLTESLNIPTMAEASLLSDPSFYVTVFAFALIASAETLLCATAVDRMHDGPRARYDKELMAQGVGNALCGMLGALPMTGVIVRSSANVEAGAKTRYSAVLHGVWLLGFLIVFPGVLQMIPTSSLAAILVYTGYKLVNPTAIKELWRAGRSEVAIYAATVTAIVATDLLTGVAVGFGLALLRLLVTFLKLEIEVRNRVQDNEVDVELRGAATFVQLPRLAQVLEHIRPDAVVHFHVGGLAYADHATLELISTWMKRHKGHVSLEWDELHRRSQNRLVLDATPTGTSTIDVRPNTDAAPDEPRLPREALQAES